MDSQRISQILNLNKEFYQLVAKDFSETRQKPWEGWGRVVDIIRKKRHELEKESPDLKPLEILDIGCGNGRFLKFLAENLDCFSYTGIDINNDLLKEARKIELKSVNQSAKFIKKDIFNDAKSLSGAYDVIVAFGVTHHIPDADFRKKWFLDMEKLLKSEPKKISLLCLTFWDFGEEPGDYFLGWKNREDSVRYCHKYSDRELNNIIKGYEKLGFKKIDSYTADNKNTYFIFGKI